MTVDDIIDEVTVIQNRLSRVLDDAGRRALADVRSDLEQHRERHGSERNPTSRRPNGKSKRPRAVKPWRLIISPAQPLSFVPSKFGEHIKHRLAVDIACDLSKPIDGKPSGKHNIAVRVWAVDVNLSFRADWDAVRLAKEIGAVGRRVMLRFHFDFADAEQAGPTYHLQIGGKQHEGERCWYPDNIKVPRFVHHPVNLVTVCEFVVRTFHPTEYDSLCKETSWQLAVGRAQLCYLPAYFERIPFLSVASPPSSFRPSYLDALWNIP